MKTKYICPTAQKIALYLEETMVTSSLEVSNTDQDKIKHESEILTQRKEVNPIWD